MFLVLSLPSITDAKSSMTTGKTLESAKKGLLESGAELLTFDIVNVFRHLKRGKERESLSPISDKKLKVSATTCIDPVSTDKNAVSREKDNQCVNFMFLT